MTPDQAIADLDRELASTGTTIRVRRASNAMNSFADVDLPARVVFQGGGDSVAQGTGQRQRIAKMHFSLTQILAANWPTGTSGGSQFARVPKSGDIVQLDGRDFTVVAANPVYLGSSIVRVNAEVKG